MTKKATITFHIQRNEQWAFQFSIMGPVIPVKQLLCHIRAVPDRLMQTLCILTLVKGITDGREPRWYIRTKVISNTWLGATITIHAFFKITLTDVLCLFVILLKNTLLNCKRIGLFQSYFVVKLLVVLKLVHDNFMHTMTTILW